MSERTGEEILETGLLEVHEEIQPGAVFDPTILVGVISGIMALIQGCKEASASRQIKRGGAISKRALREVLRREGYHGDTREAAKRLAEKGRSLTDEDIKAILDDSDDVPENSGWWPTAVGAIVLSFFLPSISEASWWPTVEAQPVVISEPLWPTEPPPPQVMHTRIILEVADNCGPCNVVKTKKLPVLEKAGWKIGPGSENHIQVVDVTGTDHGAVPAWNLVHHGKEFAELIGADYTTEFIGEWYNTFVECGRVLDEPEKAKVKTVSNSGVPSGGSWVYYGSGSLAGHLVRNHGYTWSDVQGLSHGQLVFLHSYAHNNGRPYRVQRASQNRIVRAYCPTCPR